MREIRRRILVRVRHRGIEPVAGDSDALAQDGSLESQRRKVSLQLTDERFTKHHHIVYRGDFAVIDGHTPQAA